MHSALKYFRYIRRFDATLFLLGLGLLLSFGIGNALVEAFWNNNHFRIFSESGGISTLSELDDTEKPVPLQSPFARDRSCEGFPPAATTNGKNGRIHELLGFGFIVSFLDGICHGFHGKTVASFAPSASSGIRTHLLFCRLRN